MIHKLKSLTYFIINNVFLKLKYIKLKHSNMKTILLILVIKKNVDNLEKKEDIEKETKMVKTI